MKVSWLKAISITSLFVFTAACATSPTGRKQLKLLPDSQMNSMGEQAFQQMAQEQPQVTDPAMVRYVNCVVEPLLKELPEEQRKVNWEVKIFKDESANAFALPGGNIGVHSGLLKVAKTDAQLGAVIGHEIGHVIAEHGNERVSQALAANAGLLAAGALAKDSEHRQLILGLLGLGAQVGVLLPFGRTQEKEADVIGLELMAKAGFDPAQAVELWKNMQAASNGAPPEFLSTHPSSQSRIERLQEKQSEVRPLYQKAKAAGKTPDCKRPS